MLALSVVTAIFAGGSLWAAVHFGLKALREARAANALAGERSVVEWYVDRQDDDNPGLFYARNTGQDTAHEVTLVAWDGNERVEVEVDAVRPYKDCIEFHLTLRGQNGPKPVPGPIPRVPTPEPPAGPLRDHLAMAERLHDDMIAKIIAQREREQVWVRITWRSALGKWTTETLQTG